MRRVPFLHKKNIYSWEGGVFNLICALYFAFLSPYVLEASIRNFEKGPTQIHWLGFALIIISILEVYAFPKKMKYVHKAIMDHGGHAVSVFYLWMLHAVISIIILFMIVESFGYEIVSETGQDSMPWWMSILLPGVVLKELYLLFTIIGTHDETDALEAYDRPNNKEWILDLILLSYACLAYTVTWETITNKMQLKDEVLLMYVVNLILMAIIFLICYLPIRIPYFIEELNQLKTNKDRFKFVISILMALVAAVSNF
jgi:hypothetical protein